MWHYCFVAGFDFVVCPVFVFVMATTVNFAAAAASCAAVVMGVAGRIGTIYHRRLPSVARCMVKKNSSAFLDVSTASLAKQTGLRSSSGPTHLRIERSMRKRISSAAALCVLDSASVPDKSATCLFALRQIQQEGLISGCVYVDCNNVAIKHHCVDRVAQVEERLTQPMRNHSVSPRVAILRYILDQCTIDPDTSVTMKLESFFEGEPEDELGYVKYVVVLDNYDMLTSVWDEHDLRMMTNALAVEANKWTRCHMVIVISDDQTLVHRMTSWGANVGVAKVNECIQRF
jgi:hypothetical protein